MSEMHNVGFIVMSNCVCSGLDAIDNLFKIKSSDIINSSHQSIFQNITYLCNHSTLAELRVSASLDTVEANISYSWFNSCHLFTQRDDVSIWRLLYPFCYVVSHTNFLSSLAYLINAWDDRIGVSVVVSPGWRSRRACAGAWWSRAWCASTTATRRRSCPRAGSTCAALKVC